MQAWKQGLWRVWNIKKPERVGWEGKNASDNTKAFLGRIRTKKKNQEVMGPLLWPLAVTVTESRTTQLLFCFLLFWQRKWSISNFIPGFRNTTGCKLGWVLEPRSWCKGRSWTIWPLGCLNRFIPLGLLTGCKTIRCPWSCVFGTGLRVGEPCCTGINNNRGPGRFTVLGETCEVATGIWGAFSEKQEMET